MSLDEIRGRMEKAIEARVELHEDGEASTGSIRAAFIAEQSSYDVPKLLAAVEAALIEADRRAEQLRGSADILDKQVIERHPDKDPESAVRYNAYATEASCAAIAIRKAINAALEGER